jgi:integrase
LEGFFLPKKIDYAALFTRRSDGRYQDFNSKRTPKYLYDRDPEELYKKVEAAKNPSAPFFQVVAEAWHDVKWEQIRAGTKVCYGPAYKRAVEEQDGKAIDEITSNDINNHIKKLISRGFSKRTISAQKTVYGMIFNYAITTDDPHIKGWLKINPATEVKVPRGLPKKSREAPEDDVIEIIRTNTDKPFGLFPRMLINTGFRREELAALTWGDVDFKRKKIKCNKAIEYADPDSKLKDPKSEAGAREVPILPDLESVLIRPDNAKSGDLVFPGKKGSMSVQEYKTAWLRWCVSAGLTKKAKRNRKYKKNGVDVVRVYNKTVPAITAHQLRHYYATMLYEARVDELTAMKYMGHADRSTIHNIYEHLRNSKKDASESKLANYQKKHYTGLKSKKD